VVEGESVQVATVTPAQPPPLQAKDVAAGEQLAVSVEEPPAAIDAGLALRVHTGVSGVWQASQSPPVAVFHAASMAASPLETR